jgi:DNA/RNA endonuclease YhcR with UshA esterase domain
MGIMKLFAAALAILATPAIAATIAPSDAAKHLGEVVTVEGVVVDVHAAPNGMILFDLGGKSPGTVFTAVIFPKNAPAFDSIEGYVGNEVAISGAVQLYQGKPEITLTNAGQIQVNTAAHNQKLGT